MNKKLTIITVETIVNINVEKVWKFWTNPADIIQWNSPSDNWHTSLVEIDLKEGGTFLYRMETKDRSPGFDFYGKYDKVIPHELIEYTVSDGRKVINTFISNSSETVITEMFEAETATPVEMQVSFCQSILNNFKKFAENKSR